MRYLSTITIVSILSLIGSVKSFDAGAAASLNVGVIEQAKEVYWNYVMNILKNVQIPDISFHDGHLNHNSFFVNQASKNVQITTNSGQNGVNLGVIDLQAGFHSSSFEYKISFIKATGSVDVKMSEVNIGVTLRLTT